MNKEIKSSQILEVSDICNYYGGLVILKHESRFYWMIESFDSDMYNLNHWTEIGEDLYNAILPYTVEEKRKLKDG